MVDFFAFAPPALPKLASCLLTQQSQLDGHSDPELGEGAGPEERKPSVNERLKDVLNKPREKLEIEDARDQEKDQEVEKDRDIDRGPTHGL